MYERGCQISFLNYILIPPGLLWLILRIHRFRTTKQKHKASRFLNSLSICTIFSWISLDWLSFTEQCVIQPCWLWGGVREKFLAGIYLLSNCLNYFVMYAKIRAIALEGKIKLPPQNIKLSRMLSGLIVVYIIWSCLFVSIFYKVKTVETELGKRCLKEFPYWSYIFFFNVDLIICIIALYLFLKPLTKGITKFPAQTDTHTRNRKHYFRFRNNIFCVRQVDHFSTSKIFVRNPQIHSNMSTMSSRSSQNQPERYLSCHSSEQQKRLVQIMKWNVVSVLVSQCSTYTVIVAFMCGGIESGYTAKVIAAHLNAFSISLMFQDHIFAWKKVFEWRDLWFGKRKLSLVHFTAKKYRKNNLS